MANLVAAYAPSAGMDHELEAVAELGALFIKMWLVSTPKIPLNERETALREAQERYDRLVECLVAEVGDSSSHFIVNTTDEVVIMADGQLGGAVSIDSRSDINRDGQVNTTDVILARTNHVVPLKALKVITAPLE